MIKERSWFSQINFFVKYFPHRINNLFFPANLMSSTYTDKITLFHDVQRDSQLETFSQPYFNRIFSSCLSHNSPAKGWPYRFRSRRKIRSSIVDHDFGHLCRGRRIQMSGHCDLKFTIILKQLPFGPGYKQILRPLHVLRTQAVWIWYPWLLLLSFVILMILVL